MTEQPPGRELTLLIADDHALFREGLAALIRGWDGYRLVGAAASGFEAVEKARELRPDLVLMDLRMPGLNGAEAVRLIRRTNPEIRVVMLTMSTLGDDVFTALRNGAHGYLSKDEPAHRIRSFLDGVARGEIVVSGDLGAQVLAQLTSGGPGPKLPGRVRLTAREHDVLKLVVEGHANEEIATCLGISEATVKKHLGRIMDKLHLHNRVQVAVYGLRQGLVD